MANFYGTNNSDTITPGYVSPGVGKSFFFPRPGNGSDRLYGNGGNDHLNGGGGNDYLYGGSGNDWLDGGYGYDVINGGSGTDTTSYTFFNGSVNASLATGVVSFPGNGTGIDRLYSIENIYTGNGNDRITGSVYNNVISSGAGNDYVDAGSGNDTIYAGSGNDTVYGGSGNDYLSGSSGNDWLDGGYGFDTINGGTGTDSTSYTWYNFAVNANLDTGVVSFPGNGTGTDQLYSIENIYTGAGNDTITGEPNDANTLGGRQRRLRRQRHDYIDGGSVPTPSTVAPARTPRTTCSTTMPLTPISRPATWRSVAARRLPTRSIPSRTSTPAPATTSITGSDVANVIKTGTATTWWSAVTETTGSRAVPETIGSSATTTMTGSMAVTATIGSMAATATMSCRAAPP